MTNLFNMLNDTAKKQNKGGGNSQFGNLVDKQTYTFKINEAKATVTKAGNPMLVIDSQTISGDTGVGTKIKSWYVLNTDSEGNLEEGKEFQSTMLMQLIGAINITASDILADNYQDFLGEIAERINELPAKTFLAEVEAKPDYVSANGKTYKQWGIKGFSVMPNNAINAEDTEGTTTSAETLKNDFDFSA